MFDVLLPQCLLWVSWPCSGQAPNAVMVMEVFVPSGLALAGVILISGFLRQKKISISRCPVKISACTVPAWQGRLVPGAALRLLLSMSTDSSAWTTPLPLLSQCLSQRGGVQGTADSPASSSHSCKTAQPVRNVQFQRRPSSYQPHSLPSWMDTAECRGHQDFVRAHFRGHLPFPKHPAFTSCHP